MAPQTRLAESKRIQNRLNAQGFGMAEGSYKVTANFWSIMNVEKVSSSDMYKVVYLTDLQEVP